MSSEKHHLKLPPLIMGGAGFSYQLSSEPASLPVLETVKRAFELGLRAIDTSPYYEPSEQLLGAALSHPDIVSKYQRSDFIIMTKCGRIAASHFDYSAAWISKSVARSLERFHTSYLDVVFCHDVEYVTLEEAVGAVGVLFEFQTKGIIRNVGISGYDLAVLLNIATAVRAKYGRTVDLIQNWAQLTLQNTRLERDGLAAFRKVGVKAVCNASPLAVGLLRDGGVPIGKLGDWHPSPSGLRAASQEAAAWVQRQGDNLASLGLRFAIAKALKNSTPRFTVTTITGIGSISDLHENVDTAKRILAPSPNNRSSCDTKPSGTLDDFKLLNYKALALDTPLYQAVRNILGPWIDYDFSRQPNDSGESSSVQKLIETLNPKASL